MRTFSRSMQNKNRHYWGKVYSNLPPLNLTQVQLESWDWFLREGIKKSISEISPIEDFTAKSWQLEFLEHFIEKPNLTPLTASRKGLTYSASLRVKAKLTNKVTGKIASGEVFLGDIPMMTPDSPFSRSVLWCGIRCRFG